MKNQGVIHTDSFKEMIRVLKNEPKLSVKNSSLLLGCCIHWPHGPVHETIAPMNQHVILAHFGKMQHVERRTGKNVVKSTFREGTISTIPCGSSSRWDMSGSIDVIHFYIPEQSYKDLLQQVDAPPTELLPRTAHYDEIISKIISSISDTLRDYNPISQLLCEHLILALMLQLIRNDFNAKTRVHESNANCILSTRALKNALEILDSSPVGAITIQALAAELNISPAHFCRAFKNSTGLTPYSWLKQRVMERAFLQLQSTNKPVSEIAVESGYSSQNAFTNAFIKITGLAPSQWRKIKNDVN